MLRLAFIAPLFAWGFFGFRGSHQRPDRCPRKQEQSTVRLRDRNGLAGQGDSRIEYTELGILNALESLGIRADKADKSRTIAAVMVTADIGPFAKEGAKMDVTVSSIGNADSLQGGVLLQTPLYGADGKVYSVAQGPVSVGGLSAGNAGGANVQVNHPTVGMVSNGATVEREIESQVLKSVEYEHIQRSPDSSTSVKIDDAVNQNNPGTSLAK